MSKLVSVELTKERDGVKAIIDATTGSVNVTVTFDTMLYFPMVLNRENLKDMKKEIDLVLKEISKVEKELNPSPIKKVVRKVSTKKTK